MNDDQTLTFTEFHSEKYNIKIHEMWVSILKDYFNENDSTITINIFLLNLVSDRFSSLQKFKKFLKKNKINYVKIGKSDIVLDLKKFQIIMLTYGSKEFKEYFIDLPLMMHDYDKYIFQTKLEKIKNNIQE